MDVLEKLGWTVECESPYEIRHEDGSFATGQAADIVSLALANAIMRSDTCAACFEPFFVPDYCPHCGAKVQ